MKNADMPAYPIEFNGFGRFAPETHFGLSKREEFVKAAMQSVLNNYNPYESGDFDSSDYDTTAKHCIALADAVLKELEKSNEEVI